MPERLKVRGHGPLAAVNRKPKGGPVSCNRCRRRPVGKMEADVSMEGAVMAAGRRVAGPRGPEHGPWETSV